MFRAGTLAAKVEGVEKPVEAVFYHFPGPGGGGGVEANVQRWLGQFQGTPESKREEIDAGGKKITLVTATGTYNDGPPMGAKTPKADYTLVAAIVPTEDFGTSSSSSPARRTPSPSWPKASKRWPAARL